MSLTSKELPLQPPVPPRGIAYSGIVFAMIYLYSTSIIRHVIPADPADSGAWLVDVSQRELVERALFLVPFCGIAFLW